MNKRPTKNMQVLERIPESKNPKSNKANPVLHSSTQNVQDQLKISTNDYLFGLYEQSIRKSCALFDQDKLKKSLSQNENNVYSNSFKTSQSNTIIKQKIPYVEVRSPPKMKIPDKSSKNNKKTIKKPLGKVRQTVKLSDDNHNKSCNIGVQQNLELSFSNDDNSFVIESTDAFISPKFKPQEYSNLFKTEPKQKKRSIDKKSSPLLAKSPQGFKTSGKTKAKASQDLGSYRQTTPKLSPAKSSPRPMVNYAKLFKSQKDELAVKKPKKIAQMYSPQDKSRQETPDTVQDLTRSICFEREILINEKLQSRLERIKELKLELLQLEYETYQIEAQRNQYFNQMYNQQIQKKI